MIELGAASRISQALPAMVTFTTSPDSGSARSSPVMVMLAPPRVGYSPSSQPEHVMAAMTGLACLKKTVRVFTTTVCVPLNCSNCRCAKPSFTLVLHSTMACFWIQEVAVHACMVAGGGGNGAPEHDAKLPPDGSIMTLNELNEVPRLLPNSVNRFTRPPSPAQTSCSFAREMVPSSGRAY